MGKIPKYQVLMNWIKERIESGQLMPGDKLASEHDLCVQFAMSRQTVRHALSVLEADGIIEGRQGSGNYICNLSLNKKRTSQSVVIVSTYLNGYIFPKIIEGMERVLSGNGYSVQIAFTHNKVEKERIVLKRLLEENHIGGLIIEPTKSGLPNPNADIYEQVIERKIPTLFFHSYYPRINLPHVSLDDEYAGYTAARYLLEAGHKKIAGIFKADDGQGHRRYQGYVKALLEAGIKIREEHIAWIDTEDQKTMMKDAKRYLRRIKDCTGCVCYNDTVAFDLERICVKSGVAIPDQLSLVSIDNSEQAELCEVPVTSVIHPMEALGEKAACNLIGLMADESFDANYEFITEVYERDSVKRLS